MNLQHKIDNKKVITGIIGLGYVGLPLMNSICCSGRKVLGFDIDTNKIKKLNSGKSYLDTVPEKIISTHRKSRLFEATDDFNRLKDVDVIVICVPTPLGENRDPDLSYVINTTETISKNLRKDQLIILESTTYPGTLSDVVRPILETETGLKAGVDFYLAFSPEREDPGNPNFETSTIPKVVGADNTQERDAAVSFYQGFLKTVVPVSSSATAEAVKITENIFRAVNIALVNELKVIYDAMGIDIWEVVKAAKTKPFGYMPFYPGPGLGGHCIPIDPFYLTWKAQQIGLSTRFIELAGEINTSMPDYVVDKVEKTLMENKSISIDKSKILILGVAYKKNINDQRESPAFAVMEILSKKKADVSFFDPHVCEVGPMREFPQFSGKKSVCDLEKAIKEADIVLVITDHDKIDYKTVAEIADLIVDTRNAFDARGITKKYIFKA
ncbi:MAG: nucleotide sugar dehydrogenase [Alphaproteobacteria bacterium]